MVEEYGDPKSAQLARGGGPFLLKDSPDLVEQIFKRMGYLDDYRNQLKDEAVETFLRGERNHRELQRLGVVIGEADSVLDKLSKIRLACLSSSCGGRWQLPPSDRNVREHLVARGLLNRESSLDETSQAMEASVKSSGSVPMKSYHGLVAQYQDVFFGRRQDPSRRR
ncbi:unnamed protein product [Prorocentrum cordatum]|uniref:Uncharacterized protein n=1 Tax=Prorocentrum cordatum TaxID=2364126 RepID=A0ABN9RVB2_9DINO|nr:unnamed protein product [Polarella glacialis]